LAREDEADCEDLKGARALRSQITPEIPSKISSNSSASDLAVARPHAKFSKTKQALDAFLR
jgi:hypothetical protein